MNNSRFTVALHILNVLAMGFEKPITSDTVAKSVNTNPVVIRRILGTLRQAGMVISRPGVGGGIELNREPGNITLLDVYRLFKDDELFPMHPNQPHQLCSCGSNIQAVLGPVYEQAESAMDAVLAQKTLADLAAETWKKHHDKMRE